MSREEIDWRVTFRRLIRKPPPRSTAEFEMLCDTLQLFGEQIYDGWQEGGARGEEIKANSLTILCQLVRFVIDDIKQPEPMLSRNEMCDPFNFTRSLYFGRTPPYYVLPTEVYTERAQYLSSCGFPGLLCEMMELVFDGRLSHATDYYLLATLTHAMKMLCLRQPNIQLFVESGYVRFATMVFNQASDNPTRLQNEPSTQGCLDYIAGTLVVVIDDRVTTREIDELIAASIRVMRAFPVATSSECITREAEFHTHMSRLWHLGKYIHSRLIDMITRTTEAAPVIMRSAWQACQATLPVEVLAERSKFELILCCAFVRQKWAEASIASPAEAPMRGTHSRVRYAY